MKKFLGETNSVNSIDQAKVIILPIPFEFSTSYGKGTIAGPRAIIEASPFLEFYDQELDFEPWKAGVFTTPNIELRSTPEHALAQITEVVQGLLTKNKFLIAIGGEHTISYAIYRAFDKQFKELSVVQLDAHSDLRNEYEGSRYSHACVMRRIWELNPNIVQIGIRSLCIEERQFIGENNINTFYAHDLVQSGFGEEIFKKLRKNVYVTLDVDFFDPSLMPSTGTPEPGGFEWYETIRFLQTLFFEKKISGEIFGRQNGDFRPKSRSRATKISLEIFFISQSKCSMRHKIVRRRRRRRRCLHTTSSMMCIRHLISTMMPPDLHHGVSCLCFLQRTQNTNRWKHVAEFVRQTQMNQRCHTHRKHGGFLFGRIVEQKMTINKPFLCFLCPSIDY